MKTLSHNPSDSLSAENVAKPERFLSVLGGAALATYGTSQRSIGGALLAVAGSLLIFRGVSGRCQLYRMLGVDTAHYHNEYGVHGNKGIKIEREVRIQKPAGEIFDFWRHLSNLPKFMPHVVSVEEKDRRYSHWVVKGPAGTRLSWDAEIINEHPGEMISWQSLPGAQVENAGTIRFHSIDGGQATDVRVALQYYPPIGATGAAVARALGEAPEKQLESDLAMLRDNLEATEVAKEQGN